MLLYAPLYTKDLTEFRRIFIKNWLFEIYKIFTVLNFNIKKEIQLNYISYYSKHS